MAQIVIEFDLGDGWLVRDRGESAITMEALMILLPEYALQYPHRAFLDGELVAEAHPLRPPPGERPLP